MAWELVIVGVYMKYSRWELNYEVIDLTSDGINNYAFDLPSAMAFICEAVSHGFLILGGDIIIREGKHYIESCDNWYCNENNPMETAQKAMEYLSAYHLRNCDSDKKWWVSVLTNDNIKVRLTH